MNKRYQKSNKFFKQASSLIPLASQTFSKSYYQYVKGNAPLFITHGKGCCVWDLDGNKYVDMINGLLAVSLGYQYPAVDIAISKQLKKGISFSLPSPLEAELAQLLTKHIPCAEMVRFGKNGSDATTGAIRVARAVTGRDHVAVCGYHGWHDWYIGSTSRNLGVPAVTRKLTHVFKYNDLKSLENIFSKNRNKIAAVIIEPVSYIKPDPNFLKRVKALAHKNGALLIFDEVITGFRVSLGGAQKYYKVTPDLAAFGKSMGNGMPISVLVGKKKYMKVVEDIFYSFTFGGEALSLAASIATIKEMKKRNFAKVISKKGSDFKIKTDKLIKKHGLTEVMELKGENHWQVFIINNYQKFSSTEIKTYLQQELLNRGVLWYGQHNFSLSHKKSDLDYVAKQYDIAFALLAEKLAAKTLRKSLKGGLITNLFKVR